MADPSPGTKENITQIGGVSYTGGTPLKEFAAMNLKEAFEDPDDYRHAVKIVRGRLIILEGLCKKLAGRPD